MPDLTEAAITRLRHALLDDGWAEPNSVRAVSFTRAQILAGDLRAAGLEADRLNQESLSQALIVAFGEQKGSADA